MATESSSTKLEAFTPVWAMIYPFGEVLVSERRQEPHVGDRDACGALNEDLAFIPNYLYVINTPVSRND